MPHSQEGFACYLYQEALMRVSRIRAAIAARQASKDKKYRDAWITAFRGEFNYYLICVGELSAFCRFKPPSFIGRVTLWMREIRRTSCTSQPDLDVDIACASDEVSRIAASYVNDWWNYSPSEMVHQELAHLRNPKQGELDRHFTLVSKPRIKEPAASQLHPHKSHSKKDRSRVDRGEVADNDVLQEDSESAVVAPQSNSDFDEFGDNSSAEIGTRDGSDQDME